VLVGRGRPKDEIDTLLEACRGNKLERELCLDDTDPIDEDRSERMEVRCRYPVQV
jgi:hypothetical protein